MKKLLIGLTLLFSMQSFATLNLGVNAAKSVLFNGERMAWLEGLTDVNDNSSAKCTAQIFSNFDGHLAVKIINRNEPSTMTMTMNINKDDNSSELKFKENLIILSNSTHTARIYLSNNLVKKIELTKNSTFSFYNTKCEF